jgi:hypothetical protein
MTDLRNRELVLGKLFAGLLSVAVIIAASLPVFCLARILGGVTFAQVLWLEALCVAAALAAGTWGSLVAFWREKTFQTLAISVLGLVLFVGLVEAAGALAGSSPLAQVAELFNPYRALGGLLDPLANPNVASPGVSAWRPVAALLGLAAVLAGTTIARLRVWNPSQSVFEQALKKQAQAEERQRHRRVWENPVVWREIETRAYGRKILVIKAAYFVLAGCGVWLLSQSAGETGLVLGMLTREGVVFVGLTLVALLLLNAQAVTSFTSERDGQTLELLLVTDITPQEFVFGKLGGIFYNTWQVLAVPLLFLVAAWYRGRLSLEDASYVLGGIAALAAFCAMLGLHSGFTYNSSRTAIANSLGTVFFLFIGVFICLMLIVEARSSYALQLQPFAVFILGGTLGLMASLTRKNPAPALKLAAFLLPFCTFYAITAFLLQNTLGVFLVVLAAYGFTTVAMLVPAISEFGVALGRSARDVE